MGNKSTGKTVTIIVLILIILGLGGYIAYDKIIAEKNISESEKTEEKKTEDTANDLIVKKVYEDKDWAYDADYEYDVEKESYESKMGIIQNIDDIKVPYINIDNMVIDNLNKEIKSVFDEAISVYNDGAKGELFAVEECNYTQNLYDNVLSVKVKYQLAATDYVNPDYYTYNIDTTTGELITFKDAYTLLGYDEETINEKINTKIVDLIKQMNFTDDDQYMIFSYKNYEHSVKDGCIKFYIDENNKLNVVVDLYVPAGSGLHIETITID